MATLSLEAREFECGAESMAAAASLQSLASAVLATGRAAEAEALCQRCLKIRCMLLLYQPPPLHLADHLHGSRQSERCQRHAHLVPSKQVRHFCCGHPIIH